MKRLVLTACSLALCVIVAGAHQQPGKTPMPTSKATNPVFEQIKALAGEWEGTTESGLKGSTSYKVLAAGSAVENRLLEGTNEEMVTIFHLDGPDVMVTHYCAAGNQPRMVAKPSGDPKVISFVFKDATNLSSPNAEHMRSLVLRFIDANHHRQEWTSRGNGKETSDVFDFTRKKK